MTMSKDEKNERESTHKEKNTKKTEKFMKSREIRTMTLDLT